MQSLKEQKGTYFGLAVAFSHPSAQRTKWLIENGLEVDWKKTYFSNVTNCSFTFPPSPCRQKQTSLINISSHHFSIMYAYLLEVIQVITMCLSIMLLVVKAKQSFSNEKPAIHQDSGSSSSSGHRLLLFLSCPPLHHLEVVKGCREVVHQTFSLQLVLPLEERRKERIKTISMFFLMFSCHRKPKWTNMKPLISWTWALYCTKQKRGWSRINDQYIISSRSVVSAGGDDLLSPVLLWKERIHKAQIHKEVVSARTKFFL